MAAILKQPITVVMIFTIFKMLLLEIYLCAGHLLDLNVYKNSTKSKSNKIERKMGTYQISTENNANKQ